MLSPETLQEPSWETRIRRIEAARYSTVGSQVEKFAPLIGGCVAVGLWLTGHFIPHLEKLKIVAYVAASIAALLFLYSHFAPNGKAHLKWLVEKLVFLVGTVVTHLLLVPVYLLGFGFVGLLGRVGRDDKLQLRRPTAPGASLWLATDQTARKDAAARTMFAADSPRQGGFLNGLMKLAVCGLVLFIIGEIFLRTKGYDKPLLYMQDVYAGYRIQPNQHVFWEEGEVVINNFGMRNRENITVEKPVDTFRVCLIGDSTLYGNDDLKQEATYAAMLEEKLDRTGKTQVLNCGVNGAGPDQNWGFLKRYDHAFHSDVVIVCMPLADIYRAKNDLGSSRWQMQYPRLAWETVAVYYLPELKNKLSQRTTYSSVDPFFNYDEFADYSIGKYVELAQIAQKAGAEVWFQIMPQLHNGYDADAGVVVDPKAHPGDKLAQYYQKHFDLLSEKLKAVGVKCFLPSQVFKGKGKSAEMWHDNAHLGPKGHAVYADYLESQIAAESQKWQAFKAAHAGANATK